jgi:hypothetical protein
VVVPDLEFVDHVRRLTLVGEARDRYAQAIAGHEVRVVQVSPFAESGAPLRSCQGRARALLAATRPVEVDDGRWWASRARNSDRDLVAYLEGRARATE